MMADQPITPSESTWLYSLSVGSELEAAFRPVLLGVRSFSEVAREVIADSYQGHLSPSDQIAELQEQVADLERDIELVEEDRDAYQHRVTELEEEVERLEEALETVQQVESPTRAAPSSETEEWRPKKHQWVPSAKDLNGWECSVCGAQDTSGRAKTSCGAHPTGNLCFVCRKPQFETPSGITCQDGHGGAEPLECLHASVVVPFDLEAASRLSSEEVQRRWPRFWGECPDCGVHVIKYASREHFMAGDW